MYLQMLTTKELLAYAEQQIDELTSTDLERELIKRLAKFEEVEAACTAYDDLLDGYALDYQTLQAHLAILDTHHVESDGVLLKQKLERADKFYALVQSNEDVIDLLRQARVLIGDRAVVFTKLANLAEQIL